MQKWQCRWRCKERYTYGVEVAEVEESAETQLEENVYWVEACVEPEVKVKVLGKNTCTDTFEVEMDIEV